MAALKKAVAAPDGERNARWQWRGAAWAAEVTAHWPSDAEPVARLLNRDWLRSAGQGTCCRFEDADRRKPRPARYRRAACAGAACDRILAGILGVCNAELNVNFGTDFQAPGCPGSKHILTVP